VRSRAGFRLRHLVALFVISGGCAQTCGFEVGLSLEDIPLPDASPRPPDEPDALATAVRATDSEACIQYCRLQTENCPEELKNFLRPDDCLALCAYYPTGEATGNTLNCRLDQVQKARDTEAILYCAASSRAGSINGEQRCGEACETYCQLVLTVCENAFADAGANREQVCWDECRRLDNDGHTVDPLACRDGGDDERAGDTVQCRLWHVGAAALAARLNNGELSTHCGHAIGGGPCEFDDNGRPPGCQR
jgi:hypothetical protein